MIVILLITLWKLAFYHLTFTRSHDLIYHDPLHDPLLDPLQDTTNIYVLWEGHLQPVT